MTEPQGGQDDSWATQSIFFLVFFVDFLMVFCFVLFVWGFLVFNACYSVFYYGGLFVAVLAICGEKVSQICGVFFPPSPLVFRSNCPCIGVLLQYCE